MPIHHLLSAALPEALPASAESPLPNPPLTGPMCWLSACIPCGMPRPPRAAAHGLPPRQPMPLSLEPTSLHNLPGDVLLNVMSRVGEPGPRTCVEDARVLARSRLSEVSRGFHRAVNDIQNHSQNVQACYMISAKQLNHAARQPGPRAAHMAAAVRDLDHVHLQLHELGTKQLHEVMSMLRQHKPLRGLAVTDGFTWGDASEQALVGLLRVHKNSLKDLNLGVPLRLSQKLTQTFTELAGLESLRLDNKAACLTKHGSRTDAACARRLADALGSLPNLRSLVITGFSDAAALTARLSRLPHLQTLRISHCEAGPQDWGAIAETLQGLQAAGTARLLHLELSSAGVGDAGLVPLAPVLSGMRSLHRLDLSRNNIGPDGMAVLAGSLPGMTQLKILNLSANSLCGGGIVPLARALEKMPQLEGLHLMGADLTADDIGPLGAALRGSSRLRSLSLAWNHLRGCRAPDWAAVGTMKLESLYLDACSLQWEDVVLMAAGLKDCATLKTLKLSSNDARMPAAAEALAAVLPSLPQLETCHLPVLGEDGLRVLLPVLQPLLGRSLVKLNLDSDDKESAAVLSSQSPGAAVRP